MATEEVDTSSSQSQDDDFLMMRRASEGGGIPEGLNLTAMMDLLTIILVYLVKVYADMPAAASQVKDLEPGVTVLARETMKSGTLVLLTKTQVTQGSVAFDECKATVNGDVIEKPLTTTPGEPCYTALLNSLKQVIETNNKTATEAKAQGLEFSFDPNLLLVVDATTSYADASNVLGAAGEAGFNSFQLITKQAKGTKAP